MICKKCGVNLPQGAVFCDKCGAKLDDAVNQASASDNDNMAQYVLEGVSKLRSVRVMTYISIVCFICTFFTILSVIPALILAHMAMNRMSNVFRLLGNELAQACDKMRGKVVVHTMVIIIGSLIVFVLIQIIAFLTVGLGIILMYPFAVVEFLLLLYLIYVYVKAFFLWLKVDNEIDVLLNNNEHLALIGKNILS